MSNSTVGKQLFSPGKLGSYTLQNHLVMSPMTRNRAIGNVPNDLMVEYYGQRATAGLIVTEGTSPSANGLGYPRIPGIFSAEQVVGWARVSEAVHAKGAKIFVQLMHTGRIGHSLNLHQEARILAPSAVAADGEMYTDAQGMKAYPVPTAMSHDDIISTQKEFVMAAKNAIAAGFDGVELHAANGYLLEQFIRPNSNIRTDKYGGTIENRARFVLEVAAATVAAIGKDKVGIRLSPFGVFNDMPLYNAMESDYVYLTEKLNALGLLYLHIVDHASMGAPTVPDSMKKTMRRLFKQTLILSGGYDAARAQSDLAAGKGDLIAVGRPFLANPDLPARWQTNAPLNAADMETFYAADAKGYSDYPEHNKGC
ncbi:MAG: N-ethylmaleimide reductase [Psychromonas sp.]|jgi:N-ethylmaleimide reductase|uniref:alkene reductase n=1 Tax=Psychromonas sp. TaxID=1884585 RepID=UPI0039E413E1